MRRWFAILMLALLPLQFSWAAVAAYCGHETGQHAEHLGHHEHRHADQAKADQDSAPSTAAIDTAPVPACPRPWATRRRWPWRHTR